MSKPTGTADRLFENAKSMESKITAPGNTDDPRWLQRAAHKLRQMARKRQKGHEHKLSQKKRTPKR